MNAWQKFVSQHHDIEVIDEQTIKILNIGYNVNNRNIGYDNVLTKTPKYVRVDTYISGTNILEDTEYFETIKQFLNY